MHYVREVPFGVPCKTKLWFNERVLQEVTHLRKTGDPDGRFWKHLRRIAEQGLWNYEKGRWPIVKPEFGAYRIGFKYSRFRIIGFYADGTKTEFIALDCFEKPGQDLRQPQKDRIRAVAAVATSGEWERITDGNRFPRLA